MNAESPKGYADIRFVLTPMLDGPDELIAGYHTLHEHETRSTTRAIDQLRPAIESWYRLLTLYYDAMAQNHMYHGADSDLASWTLRLKFASVSAGTSKMVLDAALAGLYAQGFGLVRHMLETWQRMAYVQLHPEQAHRWFNKSDGTPYKEPNSGTIQRALQREWKDKETVVQVERQITFLSMAAHPTGLALGQLETGNATQFALGGTYIPGLSLRLIDKGTYATFLTLQEFGRRLSMNDAWVDKCYEVLEERSLAIRSLRHLEIDLP